MKNIVKEILSANTEAKQIKIGLKIKTFFIRLPNINFSNKDMDTKNGVAISPKASADCLNEPIRTVKFIQGIAKTIDSFKGKQIEIVYAGCGVYAPLLFTILHKYNNLNITLIDINKESIDSTKTIAETLGYKNINYVVGDACEYTHAKKIDICISECLYRGLTREPQVKITKNLGKQLSSLGVFIPKNIKITVRDTVIAELSANNTNIKPVVIDWGYRRDDLQIITEVEVVPSIIIRGDEASITGRMTRATAPTMAYFNKVSMRLTKDNNPRWVFAK